MKNLGSDLSQISAPWRYSTKYSAGLWTGVALTVVLVLANALLQMLAGMSVLTFLLKSGFDDPKEVVKAFIIGIFPASFLTAIVVWYVAKIRGGKPREIL